MAGVRASDSSPLPAGSGFVFQLAFFGPRATKVNVSSGEIRSRWSRLGSSAQPCEMPSWSILILRSAAKLSAAPKRCMRLQGVWSKLVYSLKKP